MRRVALLPIFALMLITVAGCSGNKAGNAANAAASAAAGAVNAAGSAASNAGNTMSSAASGMNVPNCGAVKAVWVNLNTKVYHEPGDPAYGKTKHGEYLCPSQAVAQGFHKAGSGKHHHKGSSSM